jgi:hypothetical protein
MVGQLGAVNRNIRDLAARVDPDDSSAWEFVCECGEEGCTERLGLPLAVYDDLKNAEVVLLAPGHQLRRSAEGWRSNPEVSVIVL